MTWNSLPGAIFMSAAILIMKRLMLPDYYLGLQCWLKPQRLAHQACLLCLLEQRLRSLGAGSFGNREARNDMDTGEPRHSFDSVDGAVSPAGQRFPCES